MAVHPPADDLDRTQTLTNLRERYSRAFSYSAAVILRPTNRPNTPTTTMVTKATAAMAKVSIILRGLYAAPGRARWLIFRHEPPHSVNTRQPEILALSQVEDKRRICHRLRPERGRTDIVADQELFHLTQQF